MKIRTSNPNKEAHKNAKRSHGILPYLVGGIALSLCFIALLGVIMQYASPSKYVDSGSITQNFNIVESEGGTYYGEVVDSIYEGLGDFQYVAGGTYSGSFSDSERSGEGSFTWENGDCFTGVWENDQLKEGTYTFSNGDSYTGTFVNSAYEDGTFTLGEKCSVYGYTSFQAVIKSGRVTDLNYQTTDSVSYKGQINGQASIIYASGNTYNGNVKEGVRDGEGTFVWKSAGKTVATYSGAWSDGVMSGRGKYYFSAQSYPYLDGNFVNGKPDGTATYYKESGNTFETTWSNGKCTKVKET